MSDDFEPGYNPEDDNEDINDVYEDDGMYDTSSGIGDFARGKINDIIANNERIQHMKSQAKDKILNSQPVQDLRNSKVGQTVTNALDKTHAIQNKVDEVKQQAVSKVAEKGAELIGGAASGGTITAAMEAAKLAKKIKDKVNEKAKELLTEKKKPVETEEEKKKKKRRRIIIICIIAFILFTILHFYETMETLTMDLENLILRREDRYKKDLIAFNDSEYNEVINKNYKKSTLEDNKSNDEKYEDPCYKRMLEYANGDYDDIFFSGGKYELDAATGVDTTGEESSLPGMDNMLKMARKMSKDKPWSYGGHSIIKDKDKLYNTTTNDCSGFVASMYYSYLQMNVGGNSSDMKSQADRYEKSGKKVNGYKVEVGTIKRDCSNLKPGDILWRSGHVGLYYGDGYQIDHGSGQGPKYNKVSAKSTPYTHYIRYYKEGGSITKVKGDGYSQTYTSSGGYTYKEYKQSRSAGGSYVDNGYGGDYPQTISHNGCGPTSVAIALSGLGKNLDPGDVAAKMGGAGTVTSYIRLENIVEEYGFQASVKHSPTKSQLLNALQKGKPVICSVNSSAGGFTGALHIMALLDVKSDGSEVYVSNPNASRTTGWVKFNTIHTALSSRYIVIIE